MFTPLRERNYRLWALVSAAGTWMRVLGALLLARVAGSRDRRAAIPAQRLPIPPGAPVAHGSTHPGPPRPGTSPRPPVTGQPARRPRTLISLGTGRRGRAVVLR